MPARALATVRSSSRAPNCMMKATSPAAKSSPMQTEAMRARDTSTSALMSKAVTRPMTASSTMGMPQRMMATHAASKGSGSSRKILTSSARLERIRNTMSFFVPPSSSSDSSFSMAFFMARLLSLCTYTPMGICALYIWGYGLSREEKKDRLLREPVCAVTAYWRSAPPPW